MLFFGITLVQNVSFSQSKKKQMEALNFIIDSVNQVIVKERNTQKTIIVSLEIQESKSKQKVDSLIIEIKTIESNINAKQKERQINESEISWLKNENEQLRDSLIALRSLKKENSTNFQSVKIGNYFWMVENLNVLTFRNGDPITEAKSDDDWERASNEGKPAWCYYNNDSKDGKKFGKLYNWYAVNDPRGLAPVGWHISKKNEWKEIEKNLGEGSEWIAAWKLKTEDMWITCNGSNETGFSALPGGYRDDKGEFQNEFDETGTLGYWGYWWNKEEVSTEEALHTVLNGGCGDGGYIESSSGNKKLGMSVRCVKD